MCVGGGGGGGKLQVEIKTMVFYAPMQQFSLSLKRDRLKLLSIM